MRFQRVLIVLGAVAFIALAHLVGTGTYGRPRNFKSPAELNRRDCRVGVLTGYASESVSRTVFPKARIVGFREFEDAFMALLAGNIEAFVYNEHVLNIALRAYPNRLKVLDEPLSRVPSVVLVSKRRPELCERLNKFIRNYRRIGLYDDMFTRWCQSDAYVPMPRVPEAAGGAELRIGTSGTEEPSSFYDDSGELTGFDIEFIRRFAQTQHLRPCIVCRPDGRILKELAAGELDLVIDDYSATEVPEGVLASDGYFDADMKVLVKRGDDDGSMLGLTRLGYSARLFNDPRVSLFVTGFLTTLALSVLAALLGFAMAWGLRGLGERLPRAGAAALDVLLEGVRLLPPPIVLVAFGCLFSSAVSAWLLALVSLSFWLAAFVEPVCGAHPAAWLPVARTKLVELVQWTSVVGCLNICDLTLAADLVCGRSLAAFGPLVSVASAYCLLCWGVKQLCDLAERKLA